MIINDMQILSVDDNDVNLKIIEAYGHNIDVRVDSSPSASQALDMLRQKTYDLIITDYMMPEMDGLEFISEIRKTDNITPIVMVTAVGDDAKLHLKALELGATDFLSKPINAGVFKARVVNLLKLRKAMHMMQDKALLLEDEVRKATAEIVEREKETLRLLGKTAEYKDPETGAHVARVAHYSKMFAAAYGLNEKMQNIIYNASPFHDIGKVAIPDSILLKPAKLTDDEFETMKSHTTIGFELLRSSKSEYLKAGGVIAFTHHEKYDGTGYPKGLKGDMIPVMGRIVAVADVFDALTSKRPYKEAWSFDESIAYIKSVSGTHFDPVLVDILESKVDDFIQIHNAIRE